MSRNEYNTGSDNLGVNTSLRCISGSEYMCENYTHNKMLSKNLEQLLYWFEASRSSDHMDFFERCAKKTYFLHTPESLNTFPKAMFH